MAESKVVYRIDCIHTMKLAKHCDLINEAVNFQTCLPYSSQASPVTSRLVRLTIFPASLRVRLSRYKWLSLCFPRKNCLRYLEVTREEASTLANTSLWQVILNVKCLSSTMTSALYTQNLSLLLFNSFCLLVLLLLKDASPTHFNFAVSCPHLP